jgi:hypothetical protein
LISKGGFLLMACAGVVACSAQNPEPSPVFDGIYSGTRRSDNLDACGISKAEGTTTARVTKGHLTIPLFGPQTMLDGSVGDDGRLRASGWAKPHASRFPRLMVLNGEIQDETLEGTASDFVCHTDVRLHKTNKPEATPSNRDRPRTQGRPPVKRPF